MGGGETNKNNFVLDLFAHNCYIIVILQLGEDILEEKKSIWPFSPWRQKIFRSEESPKNPDLFLTTAGPNQHFQTQNGHTSENCACLSPTVGKVLYSLARTNDVKTSTKDFQQFLKRVHSLVWYKVRRLRNWQKSLVNRIPTFLRTNG